MVAEVRRPDTSVFFFLFVTFPVLACCAFSLCCGASRSHTPTHTTTYLIGNPCAFVLCSRGSLTNRDFTYIEMVGTVRRKTRSKRKKKYFLVFASAFSRIIH